MKQKGFTLIEILVVIFIISLLATTVSITVVNRIKDANIGKAKADVKTLESAANMFKLDNHNFPSTDEGLEALVPDYISSLPNDPWDKPYQYSNPGQNGPIDIFTLGLDGAPGGEEEDGDIGNWNLSGKE